jgi:hypothetical protein
VKELEVRPTAPLSEAHVTPKRPYEPPTAAFVPLRLEERLLACAKIFPPDCPSAFFLS